MDQPQPDEPGRVPGHPTDVARPAPTDPAGPVDAATETAGWSGRGLVWRRPVGRAERIAAVVAGVLSLVVLVVLVISRPQPALLGGPVPTPAAPARGDPVLANQLAEQSRQVPRDDLPGRLRLLVAAHVVDPDSPVHRLALAEALLGTVRPVRLVQTGLDGGPVGYAALSSDASFLVTSAGTGRL